ncbi:MAG: hypothetical protein K2W81_03055 [Sphingomonas sp.]|uniref:hypothetical protein n=1 Tax=Sphingomonas sp. TaxID=28214 RepID=UPI0025E3152A|nr:hypothetical protein [Sphingomonas sp.]MBY0282928.1 hypothetical protein [Sphingomonas sp.]
MRFHSGMHHFDRWGVPARAGLVASVLIVPVAALSGYSDMESEVFSARQKAITACTIADIRRQQERPITDPPAPGNERLNANGLSPADQICWDAGETAADREAQRQTFVAAQRAAFAVAAMWILGFVALRTWRWINAGRTA